MRCRVLSKDSRLSDVVDAPGLLNDSGPGLAYVNLAGHIETIGENQVPNLRRHRALLGHSFPRGAHGSLAKLADCAQIPFSPVMFMLDSHRETQ